MSCGYVVTLGEGDDPAIDLGESIIRVFRYFDAEGAPVDLSEATASIHSSDPAFIAEDGTVEILEDDDGHYIKFALAAAVVQAATEAGTGLRVRGTNWFRMFVDYGNGADDMTPPIWIKVR